MAWDNKDTALTIQGLGSLASAWGQYETDKQRNKLIKEEMDYRKSLDTRALAKEDLAQANLDDAFASSDFNINKKKKKKYDAAGNEIVDSDSATTA